MISVLTLLLASSTFAGVDAYALDGRLPCCASDGVDTQQEDGKNGGDGEDMMGLCSPTLQPIHPLHPVTDSATEADVAAAAELAIANIWPDAEVQVVRLSAEAAAARPPLRVRFVDDAPRGRASAEVETLRDSSWTSAGWAYLDVAVYDTALVLTRDVDRGAELAEAVDRQRVDVTDVSAPLPPNSPLEGWSAARSLRAGTVLTARLADAPSAVENRAPLRVRYARGALSVILSCEARERGAIGETIRAACSDPRATYHVRLTAPGEGVWMRTL